MNKKRIKRSVVLWGYACMPLLIVAILGVMFGISWFWVFVGGLGFCGLYELLVTIGLYFPKVGKKYGIHRDSSWE